MRAPGGYMKTRSGRKLGTIEPANLLESRRSLRDSLSLPICPAAEAPVMVITASNTAPIGGYVYTPPLSPKIRYSGCAMEAYNDNAATTYAGESYAYPANVRAATAAGGRAIGAPSWTAEIVTAAQLIEFSYTDTIQWRVFVDGKLVQAPVSLAFTGTTTNNSAVVPGITSTTGLAVGQPVDGAGLQPATRILTVDSGTQITLTRPAQAAASVAMTAYTMPANVDPIGGGTPYCPTATLFSAAGPNSGNTTRRVRLTFSGLGYRIAGQSHGGNMEGRVRRITIEGRGPFGGFYVSPQDTIRPGRPRGRRVLVLGDSYTAGTGGAHYMTSWAKAFGYLLGVDLWPSGIGGTGYFNPGSGFQKLGDRLATDCYPWAPDAIVIAMGINDSGGTVQAEAAAVFAAIAANLPGVPVYVLGAWQPSGSPSGALVASNAAVLAAASAAPNVVAVVDPTGWVTGTGNQGSRQTNGNADYLITSDTIHPAQPGHEWLARLAAEELAGSV